MASECCWRLYSVGLTIGAYLAGGQGLERGEELDAEQHAARTPFLGDDDRRAR
jgi:hypothetical protein